MFSLPMVARLSRQLVAERFVWRDGYWWDRPESEITTDNESWFAWHDSMWLRGRILMRFVLNWSNGNEAYARQYLPSWKLPDGALRTALIGFEKQASEHIAHVIRKPTTERGLWLGMPRVVVDAYRQLVDKAPPTNALHEWLSEAVAEAEAALAVAS